MANTPPSSAASNPGENPLEQMLLGAFATYEQYQKDTTTPGTKLISETGTRRTVLAGDPTRLLATVNTSRERVAGQYPTITELEYNETIAIPPPTPNASLVAYIVPERSIDRVPDMQHIALPDDRHSQIPHSTPYGREVRLEKHSMQWGLASLVQECIRKWVLEDVEKQAGKTIYEKEKAFALANFFVTDPENMGRILLNPGNKLEKGSPLEMLMKLRRQLLEPERRAVLYRLVGIEMFKMLYSMRVSRTVEDPKGSGLKPAPIQHDNPDMLALARLHTSYDEAVLRQARNLTAPITHRAVESMRSLLRPPAV